MSFESITADVQQENDEFDIDIRLGAGEEPGQDQMIITSVCPTQGSTCNHTSGRLCC